MTDVVALEPQPGAMRAVVVPAHVGIIPDGNRRFATRAGITKDEAYLLGAARAVEAVRWCRAAGVAHVSAFGVSQENIALRPRDEVCGLHTALLHFCEEVRRVPGVTLHVFGEPEKLPDFIPERAALAALQRPDERGGTGPVVHIGVNYSSRAELAAVARALGGGAALNDAPERYLLSAGVPPVDLVVRTGGQQRLSGFLPLQTAYAELWFTDTLWPAVGHAEFMRALAWYAHQERRLGE